MKHIRVIAFAFAILFAFAAFVVVSSGEQSASTTAAASEEVQDVTQSVAPDLSGVVAAVPMPESEPAKAIRFRHRVVSSAELANYTSWIAEVPIPPNKPTTYQPFINQRAREGV